MDETIFYGIEISNKWIFSAKNAPTLSIRLERRSRRRGSASEAKKLRLRRLQSGKRVDAEELCAGRGKNLQLRGPQRRRLDRHLPQVRHNLDSGKETTIAIRNTIDPKKCHLLFATVSLQVNLLTS